MMKRVILLSAFLLVSAIGYTQEKKVWTLRELIDYAISNNLTIKRSTYNVESNEINALQTKMAMLPTLNANGNYGWNWGRTIDPTTNIFTTNQVRSSNLGANSSLLLWNGFRLFYNMKQGEVDLEAVNEDLIKARNDVILNVITLYLNVVFNKELYNVAQLQVNSTLEQLERTKKLVDAGSVPIADMLNLDAQLATNELNVIQRENSLNLSILQLKQALQLPSSTSMDVELPQLDLQNQLDITKTVDEIFDIATMTMPEIKAAELRKRSSMFGYRAAKGNLYPRLSVNASYSTIYSDQRQQFFADGGFSTQTSNVGYVQGSGTPVLRDVTTPTGQFLVPSLGDQYRDNRGRSVGISLQIPIFNGLSTRSAMQRAAISQSLADITFRETSNTLRQTVETAYNNALAAIKTYQSTEKQVKARDEAFRMAKQRYNLGAVNFVDYQVAENNLFQAESDLLRAKYDFIFRKKVLDFYQGLPLGF
ncbi:MAG TPA: TolC family protein [Cyclobacteriaceae bacterium]|nr:TolC family protein [Cyclobacteriaceae bacterium]